MSSEKEKEIAKGFSDLLSRASTLERRRAERRSRVKNLTNDLEKEKVTPKNALSAKDKNASVRNLAKRFETPSVSATAGDAQSISSLGTETTASTTTTTTARTFEPADAGSGGDKNKTSDGNSKPPAQTSAKVLMAQAAFSGTPAITEKLPPKRTSVVASETPNITEKLPPKRTSKIPTGLSNEKNKTSDGSSKPSLQPSAKVLMAQAAFSGTPAITEKLPPRRTSIVASGSPNITDKLPPKRKSIAAVGAIDDKIKNSDGSSKPSPQPSAKVLMAHAAFSGTPAITEKLPPKRTSTVASGTPNITEKLPPKRTSTVASRASMFAQQGSKSFDSAYSPTPPKIAGAPVPSEKMKRVQEAFSGPPPIAQIPLEKRKSTTSPSKPAKDGESSQFFKLAQAAFSGFSGTPGLTPQNLPPHNKQPHTPPPARKATPSNVPSPKMKLAHEMFSGTPATTQTLPPKRTSAAPTRAPPSNPGFFAAWSNINAFSQPSSNSPATTQTLPPKRTSTTPPSNPGFFAAWSNINAFSQPTSNSPNPSPPPSYGFGKSPSLAIPPAAVPQATQPPHSHQPLVALPTKPSQVPAPQDEKSILLSPEQQEAYKEKSRILKDPSASTTEKLRMYLTSVQQETSEKKKTGLDARLDEVKVPGLDAEVNAVNVPFSYGGKKTFDHHRGGHKRVAKSQSSTTTPDHLHHHHPFEIAGDDSLESQDSGSGSSDGSPTFTEWTNDMISKSIDKVVWNYSGSYSDNPRDDSPPTVETYLDSSDKKRSRFVDVDISKDGVDEFDFVEDDDDMFHDEYGVVTYEKQRQSRLRAIMCLCACIGAGLVASFVLHELGLIESWLVDDESDIDIKIPSKPWTGDCFSNKIELRMAVDRFLKDRSPTSELAEKYGWPIDSWCVSDIDDFSYLFRAQVGDVGSLVRLKSFNEDISSWDVSNGRFFNEMFLGANFNQDISKWNVGNAIDMERMFDASSFTGDLSSWDVKNVTNTKFMFRDAKNFNSDLSKWQLTPETMEGMFLNAETFSSDLNGFDVSNVRDFADVFSGAASFNGDISTWNMESAERLDNLFKNAELFNGDLSKWSLQPTSMDSTFYGTSSFTGRKGLESWDTSQVDDMHRVFAHSKFQGEISSWNLTSVTTTKEMFLGCPSFDGDVSNWDVSNVKDFSSMFDGAEAFSFSDLSKWNVSSGTKFDRMFAGSISFNQDLSMWNITSVRTMTNMFANATTYSKDLCTWGIQVMDMVEEEDDLDVSQWSLFEGTRCPEKNSLPDFSANPPGPFCFACSKY